MKRYLGFGMMLSVLLGLGLIRVNTRDAAFAQVPQQPQQVIQQPLPGVSNTDVVSHSFQVNNTTQCITVINTKSQQLLVYHIDMIKGSSTLMSARNIANDLQISAFNSEKPLPREIKSMLEQQQRR
jgi:hypothetical protein